MNDQVQNTYLETLVGEGKKYTSPEDLAKAYTHASAHITELKLKEKELSEQMSNLQTLSELLAQAKNEPTSQPPVAPEMPVEAPAHQPSTPANGGEPMDVESVVANFLAKREAEQHQKKIYDSVVGQFNGDTNKAAEFLATKAAELGVTPKWIVDQSATNPELVSRLLNIQPANRSDHAAKPDVNSLALGKTAPSGERDWAYWSTLRRENKALYAASQSEIEKELLRQGADKFYGRTK